MAAVATGDSMPPFFTKLPSFFFPSHILCSAADRAVAVVRASAVIALATVGTQTGTERGIETGTETAIGINTTGGTVDGHGFRTSVRLAEAKSHRFIAGTGCAPLCFDDVVFSKQRFSRFGIPTMRFDSRMKCFVI